MASKVIMPKQGLQMTEGTITKWLKQEGERVEAGAPLFIMETDKLSIEIAASESGVLLKILRQEGETVPITETIAIIGEKGENIAAEAPEKPSQGYPATPRARALALEHQCDLAGRQGSGPDSLIIERDVRNWIAEAAKSPKSTPLAARIAGQNQLPLTVVTGSGSRGKITRADVENHLTAAAPATAAAGPASGSSGKLIPLTGMRKVIADRMRQSLHDMAPANHQMKVDMSEAVRCREQLKAAGIKVSYTDLLIRVVAAALAEFPMLNAQMTAAGIRLQDSVNIGVAVALDDGLIVPVVRNADKLPLPAISAATADLIAKAQRGQLQPDELSGGTFTISNLGMYGIDTFTAIINPPECAILAVGKIEKTPVVIADEIVIRPIMTLSLTYDHRIVDGAPAARFLQRISQLLQNLLLLL